MERISKAINRMMVRYTRYFMFDEISEKEYNIMVEVLREILDEVEGMTEESYDGGN